MTYLQGTGDERIGNTYIQFPPPVQLIRSQALEMDSVIHQSLPTVARTTWFNLKNLQVKSADKDSFYSASTWPRACIRIHDEVLQKTDTHIQCKLRTGTSKEHISKEKWVLIIASNRRNAYDSVLLFQNMPHRMATMKPNVSNKEELNSHVQLTGKTDSSIC